MSVVISDSSCLILLTNIGRLDILERLFGEVWITSTVEKEYGLKIPSFVRTKDASNLGQEKVLGLILDPGEASSIALALEIENSRIIIDEKKGRRVARSMGLDVTGTVGVLLSAIEADLIDLDDRLIDQLDMHGFRLTPKLKDLLRNGV